MRRIVEAIFHANGTRYRYGPAAIAICKYCMLASLMCLLLDHILVTPITGLIDLILLLDSYWVAD